MSQFFVEAGAAAGSVIETINHVYPDATDNFTLEAGPGISITDITNGLEISNTGVLEINTQPPIGGNFLILPGTNCSISSSVGQSIINCSASGGSGGIVVSQNRAIFSSTTFSNAAIANYNTVPTTANSALLMSITFSPANANNILVFEVNVPIFFTNIVGGAILLFKGTTFVTGWPSQVSTGNGAEFGIPQSGLYYQEAGSTSSETYSIYYTCFGSPSNTYINQYPGVGQYFGAGGCSSVFTITEISPTGTSNPLTPITPVTHANSPYTVLMTDQFLSCDPTLGTISIVLPNSTLIGRGIIVKDATGQAASNNISVTTVGGSVTIDGVTTYTLNQAYQSISLVFSGTFYEII